MCTFASLNRELMEQICPQCNTSFSCLPQNCWCFDLPQIHFLSSESQKCICKACLNAESRNQIAKYIANLTPEKRKTIKTLGPVLKPIEGTDYTITHTGLWVFTQWYHLRRGYCCESSCVNCMYKKAPPINREGQ
jgi:hypothetical protein